MEYKIIVITGDQRTAGTDANVKICLLDDNNNKSPEFKLDKFFRNDFESGSTDDFVVKVPDKVKLGHVTRIEIWRDSFGFGSGWFLNGINVMKTSTRERSTFPIHRWIHAKHRYIIREYDTSLPQFEVDKEGRQELLKDKRRDYELTVLVPGFTMQAKNVPDEEQFSWDYKWDLLKKNVNLKSRATIKKLFSSDWHSIEEIEETYCDSFLPKPYGIGKWKSDFYFGVQRVGGCSTDLLKLCKEIPQKLGVTEEMMKPFLQGQSLQTAIDNKRIFIIDLEVLVGLPSREDSEVCSPIGLFFENSDKKLMPLAIQLQQQKGPENPVFLPTDPEYTWIMAKMWFNNADGIWHQSCTHLLFTHLLMEGVCVSTNRHIAPSHPVFRLLAPHFLYIIAINKRGLNELIAPNKWADFIISAGFYGILECIKRGFKAWRMDVEGTLPAFLKDRGIDDTNLLAYFPFRDDALLLYETIRRYVAKIVNLYYDTPEKLTEDCEIQAWAREMVLPIEKGGLGFQGVPGSGQFTTNDQLITALTSIIYMCSVAHASSNMSQYDHYGFPPYFPSTLRGKAPTTKEPLTMEDILKALPDKATSLDAMVGTWILSERGTNALGDFEVNYTFDPPAKMIVDEFRADLKEVTRIINEKNKTRYPPYAYLLPEEVPNSISI